MTCHFGMLPSPQRYREEVIWKRKVRRNLQLETNTHTHTTHKPPLPALSALLFLILHRLDWFSVKATSPTTQSSWISQQKVSHLQVMTYMLHGFVSSEGFIFYFQFHFVILNHGYSPRISRKKQQNPEQWEDNSESNLSCRSLRA